MSQLRVTVDVMIVEPGPFRTNWAGPSIKQSRIRIDDYEATAGVRRQRIGRVRRPQHHAHSCSRPAYR